MHNVITDNCKKIRPEYQPTTVQMSELKASARSDHHPPSHKLKDYSVWNILQEKVYKTHITDFDDLKHRIRTQWAKLDHAVIAAAVRQWR